MIAGVSAGTPAAAIALAADAAEAGAGALMMLPPLGYRGDARRDRAPTTAPSAEAAGLPLMAYNNPEASGVDMPADLLVRLYEEIDGDRRGQGVLGRRAADPGPAQRRARASRCSSAATTGRSRASAPAPPAGSAAWPTSLPARVRRALRRLPGGDLETARAIYRRLLPLARFDMTPKLVQYFKAAMDEVGFAGGPTRPPRLPLTDERARRARRRAQPLARGRRCMTAFEAVDSHTEGMPTRVITGGVDPIPGATMLERKLHFEAEMDDLRLLLMREPRGHAAMSGAILQPPTRDGRRLGRLFIEVSGCLPMCGHGTIGVATVLVETGMVEVREPETVVRLDTPAGLVEARVAVSGRPRTWR